MELTKSSKTHKIGVFVATATKTDRGVISMVKKRKSQVRERRVVGYCRVSSLHQVEHGQSLETQQLRISAFSVGEGLGEVDEFFSDRGVSAFKSKTSKRLGWNKMVEGLGAGDVIVASTLDRVFRSAVDAAITIEALKKQEIDLYFVDKGLATGDNITNGLTLSILASVSQFESQIKGKRIQEVKAFQAENFMYSGGKRTRGFSQEVIGGRKFLVVNQLEKQLLLLIADCKKKRDAEMKKFGITRVRNNSDFTLGKIRDKVIEQAKAWGLDKAHRLDKSTEIYKSVRSGWDSADEHIDASWFASRSYDAKGNKVLVGVKEWVDFAEKLFSVSSIYKLVSDDENFNVYARLEQIKIAERKIKLVDGEFVLAKDLASTSRREASIDGGVGHKQMSLMAGGGLRSRQKKEKAISTRRSVRSTGL